HVVERLGSDLAVTLVARHESAVQIDRNEQRVVVEHLLEVRHEPLPIDGVPMEAAAHEVLTASGGHRVERLRRELELVASEQELEHRGRRELRCWSEPTPLGIELL